MNSIIMYKQNIILCSSVNKEKFSDWLHTFVMFSFYVIVKVSYSSGKRTIVIYCTNAVDFSKKLDMFDSTGLVL